MAAGSKRFNNVTGDLFANTDLPVGFRYLADVMSAAEEQDFVRRFEQLPLQPFEFHGHLANRRIFTYGRSYVFAGQRPRADARIPDYFRPLLEVAGKISGKRPHDFEQVMLSEYPAGAGIGWHLDRPTYEDIVGISFLAPRSLRLRRPNGDKWDRRAVLIEPRSAYLLHGEVRTKWQHAILPMDQLRYSVTLRSFRSREDKSGV